MNKKKIFSILSIGVLTSLLILPQLTLGHDAFKSTASIERTLDLLPLLKEALEGKRADITPATYTLHSSATGSDYLFEISNVYLDASKNIIIKHAGYIRNLTAFNGLSYVDFDYEECGCDKNIEVLCGRYSEESNFIEMASIHIESSNVVIFETNFSVRNKNEKFIDQTLTKLSIKYNCTNGSEDNLETETAIWDGAFDFSNKMQNGMQEYPYLINTCAEMRALARVNNSGVDLKGVYFRLEQGLNFHDENVKYIPVGTKEHKFNGHFFGNSKVISVQETVKDTNYWGIFGSVGSSGELLNVSSAGTVYLDNCTYVGGIAGESQGTISLATSMMNFQGIGKDAASKCTYVGGIVGRMSKSTVTGSSSVTSMYFDSSSSILGGIAGYTELGCKIESVQFCSILSAADTSAFVGGIAGMLYENVSMSEVLKSCYVSSDDNLMFNYSITDGEVSTPVDVGEASNYYHGRLVGYAAKTD